MVSGFAAGEKPITSHNPYPVGREFCGKLLEGLQQWYNDVLKHKGHHQYEKEWQMHMGPQFGWEAQTLQHIIEETPKFDRLVVGDEVGLAS